MKNRVDEPIRIIHRAVKRPVPRESEPWNQIKRVKGRGISETEFPRPMASRLVTRRIQLRLRAVTGFVSRFDRYTVSPWLRQSKRVLCRDCQQGCRPVPVVIEETSSNETRPVGVTPRVTTPRAPPRPQSHRRDDERTQTSRAARAVHRREARPRRRRAAFAAKANACPHDPTKPYHKSPLPLETAGGLLEYSVVYTDRAMNHMSKPFCKVRPGARRCANARASRRRARACPNSFPRNGNNPVSTRQIWRVSLAAPTPRDVTARSPFSSFPRSIAQIMNDIDSTLKEAYNATSTIVMPGSGSYGMEAVARQWATGKVLRCYIARYFSYRWTDIFEQTGIPSETIVLRGQPVDNSSQPQFSPHDIDEVVKTIQRRNRPVVAGPPRRAPSSTGCCIRTRRLPPSHLQRGARARWALRPRLHRVRYRVGGHEGDGAVDRHPLRAAGAGGRAAAVADDAPRAATTQLGTTSTSMVINMRKWLEVMDSYNAWGFAYYTTMPTDALNLFRPRWRRRSSGLARRSRWRGTSVTSAAT